jgi:hypothetical protein
MKFVVLFLVVVYFAATSSCTSYHIRNFESCETSGKTLNVETCEVKDDKISVRLFVRMPVSVINVQYELYQMQDSKPRQIFKAPVGIL